MKLLPGIPLNWAVAPVRAHAFFGVWDYLSVWGDVGRDRGLFGWVWWRSGGILIFLPGIPLFLAVALIRDRVFWVIWGHLRVWSRMG